MYKHLITASSWIRKHKDMLAVLFFAVLVGVFFFRTLLLGKLPVPSDTLVGLYHPYRDAYAASYPNGIPFKNFLITDPVRQQIPWRKTAIDDIRAGKMPLWNAFSFSGTPLLANIQSGALYLLNILFFILPFAAAWSVLVMTQPFLAGLFLYWFLRNRRLSVQASFLGAICFAFSGFSIAWLTWGTIIATWLWTPLSLLAIDKIHEGKWDVRKWVALLAVSLICSFFGGHIQMFIYSAGFIFIYTIWTYRTVKRHPWVAYVIAITVVVLFTAPQWVRMATWLPTTSRVSQGAAWQKEGFFIPVQHLVQFIAPDYFGNPATLNYWGTWNYGEMVGYVGLAAIILAVVGISSQTLFWVAGLIVALLFAVASPISAVPYQLHIPFVSLLQPTRLLSVADLCISVLAAYGFSFLVKRRKRTTLLFALAGLFAVILAAWGSIFLPHVFGLTAEHAAVAKRNMIMPTLLYFGLFLVLAPYVLLKKGRTVQWWGALITGAGLTVIILFDLFRFGWKFTPFTDSSYFFPETKITSYLEKQVKPFRIMATDDRIFPPNVNEYYGIESVAGYDPIHAGRYEEYIAAMERDAPDIRPPFGYERIIAPKSLKSPLVKLLNVRYVLSFDDISSGARLVAQEGTTKVFEVTDAVPRVYLAQTVQYEAGKQKVINALYDTSFAPGYSAVVESPLHLLSTPLNLDESATISSYTDDTMTVDVSVNSSRLLVIGNMYDSGWQVLIDTVPTNIYRTNYLFMGVIVPAGYHEISVRYR